MAIRISGINLPENKHIRISLTYVYGVGESLAMKALEDLKIDPNKKAKDLNEKEVNALREYIEKKYKIEGDLRRDKMEHIKRLKNIKCWRGLRHIASLPARGQKTKKNSRTVRGNTKKTIGSGRKAAPAPK